RGGYAALGAGPDLTRLPRSAAGTHHQLPVSDDRALGHHRQRVGVQASYDVGARRRRAAAVALRVRRRLKEVEAAPVRADLQVVDRLTRAPLGGDRAAFEVDAQQPVDG